MGILTGQPIVDQITGGNIRKSKSILSKDWRKITMAERNSRIKTKDEEKKLEIKIELGNDTGFWMNIGDVSTKEDSTGPETAEQKTWEDMKQVQEFDDIVPEIKLNDPVVFDGNAKPRQVVMELLMPILNKLAEFDMEDFGMMMKYINDIRYYIAKGEKPQFSSPFEALQWAYTKRAIDKFYQYQKREKDDGDGNSWGN